MEGVDLYYNVILYDRVEPHRSGDSYFLLEHPFQRVVSKPPQMSQKTSAIIEIVIRAMNIPFPILIQQAQKSSASDDDEDTKSESDSHEDNVRIRDSKPEGQESRSRKKSSWQSNKERFAKRLEKYQLESYQVVSMLVHSSHLQALLRSVIVYYPAFSSKGNNMEISHPFKPLMHYYHDLVALKTKGKSDKPVVEHQSENNMPLENMAQMQSKVLDKDTLHALDVLLAYLEPAYSSTIQPEESRYREGLAPWGLLWLLFKPGSDVYARVDGKLAAFVVGEVTEEVGRAIIKCWSLAYKSRRLMKKRTEFTINMFIGEREISSLPVFPCTYLDESDKGKTKASLETLGETYYEILKQVPTFRAYSGYAWGKRRKAVKISKKGSEQRIYVCSSAEDKVHILTRISVK